MFPFPYSIPMAWGIEDGGSSGVVAELCTIRSENICSVTNPVGDAVPGGEGPAAACLETKVVAYIRYIGVTMRMEHVRI